ILLNHFQARIHNSEFAIQVKARRGSVDTPSGGFEILGGSQVIAGFAEQDYQAPLVLEPLGPDMMDVFDDANHSDDRSRKNPAAICIVVEADVPSGHRWYKRSAGFGHTVDSLAELPHHFEPLRRSEIQAVGERGWPGAAANQVSGSLGDHEPGAGS